MYVTVFENIYTKAFRGDPKDLPRLTPGVTVSLEEALTRTYSTDAHFSMYAGAGGSTYRHTLSSVRYYRDSQEPEPTLTVVALDLDLPGHRPWTSLTPEEEEDYCTLLEEALLTRPDLYLGHGRYYTKNGLRILLRLPEPVPISLAASYLDQLLPNVTLPGYDPLKDWTRLFRLPYVVRDGELTTSILRTLPTDAISWTPPKPLVLGVTPHPSVSYSGGVPPSQSNFFKPQSKPKAADLKGLTDPTLKEVLLRGYPFRLSKGSRHRTLLKYVTTIVKDLKVTDPSTVLTLLGHSLVQTIDALRPERDLYTEVYKMAQWAVSYSQGLALAVEEDLSQRAKEADDFYLTLSKTLDCTVDQAKTSLIVSAARGYYVLDPTTLTYRGEYTQETLVTAVRDLLGGIISVDSTKADGSPGGPRSTLNLMRYHGTSVSNLKYNYSGVNTLSLPDSTLHCCLRKVREVEGKYHQEIADFLALWGEDVTTWISTILTHEEPCAALYLHAGPSTGKSLLAKLVSYALGGFVEFDRLSNSFNENLRLTYFVWADEGVDFDSRKNPATLLRRLVGNGERTLSVKYRDSSTLKGYLRVLLTGNNRSLLKFREALTHEDIDALRERVLYTRTTPEQDSKLTNFLRETRSTYSKSKGFCPTDPKAPNVFEEVWPNAFLEHVTYLRDHHKYIRGERFLVEGKDSSWSLDLRTKHGIQMALASTIARIATSPGENTAVTYLSLTKAFYVNVSDLSKAWPVYGYGPTPKVQHLTQSLRTLSTGSERIRVPSGSRVNCWRVPQETILRAGEEIGLDMESACLST